MLTNYQKLFAGKRAPLWQLAVPFGSKFSANGEPVYFSVGPMAPAAIRWMINTVFMAVMSMILTCLTAAMAGYALAKKRFVGRKLLFTLIVCAMALPKQVILIPPAARDERTEPVQHHLGGHLPHRGLAVRRVPDEAVQ